MVSIADQVAVSPQAAVSDAPRGALAAPPPVRAKAPSGERELRLDLFRGLALWLIFVDHVSPDLLSWFTIRSYGFSDAAEIFIFISGYTAALVYGRAMLKSGFVIASARILKRVWQIYAAHLLLFMILVATVSYIAVGLDKPFYAREMEIEEFIRQPGTTMIQAVLLRYRPLNMDVLPLYTLLMFFLPLILLLIRWRADLALALSIGLYVAAWKFDLYLTTYPHGFWGFNPFAWQMLFVLGAWCSLGGAKRIGWLMSSPVTLWVACAYLLVAFGITLTWYFPQLNVLVPRWVERLIYPINKTDLDVLRFAHFLALSVIAVRFVPAGWPGLKSPWLRPMILCGQFSLQIFSLGVYLAFAGYFLLMETSAGLVVHVLVGMLGILIMCAVAWLFTWFRRVADKSADPPGSTTASG
jgi:hypothetical protein